MKDANLIFKKKKATDKEYAHIDVYKGEVMLGYIIRNDSKFATINENWNFVSKHEGFPMLKGKTKENLINQLKLL
jgi:hypothetical protein